MERYPRNHRSAQWVGIEKWHPTRVYLQQSKFIFISGGAFPLVAGSFWEVHFPLNVVSNLYSPYSTTSTLSANGHRKARWLLGYAPTETVAPQLGCPRCGWMKPTQLMREEILKMFIPWSWRWFHLNLWWFLYIPINVSQWNNSFCVKGIFRWTIR